VQGIASVCQRISDLLIAVCRTQMRLHNLAQRRSVFSLAFTLMAVGLTPAQGQVSNFKHIVFVIQENRTPDNFFQGLCNPPFGTATSCSTTPSSNQYNIATSDWLDKTSPSGVTQPVAGSLIGTFDMDHNHSGFVALCDVNTATGICRMDGQAGSHCHPSCPVKKAQYEYVDYTTGVLNPYLIMATQYGWANYMFQTNQGPSFAAHHFLFGGTSAPTTADDAAGIFASENAQPTRTASGCIAQATTTVEVMNAEGVEFETIYPCLQHKTLPNVLPLGTTWRYYSAGAGWIGNAPTGIRSMCQSTGFGGTCKGPGWIAHVDTNPSDVLSDIAACKLRSVSWVTPTTANSDHARGNDGGGPSWVASIVNAIGSNKTCDGNIGYWNDTAIIVTWDDWGGWYDHEPPPVPPPPQNAYQYGARVPMIFISAYTPRGYIDNTKFYDFGSFLRFVEQNFGIAEGALNFADARSQTDLRAFYDLTQAPHAFQPINAAKNAEFFLNDKRPITEGPDEE
jgi:phospholipase C